MLCFAARDKTGELNQILKYPLGIPRGYSKTLLTKLGLNAGGDSPCNSILCRQLCLQSEPLSWRTAERGVKFIIILFFGVDDYLADIRSVKHHLNCLVYLAETEAVGDHAVKAHLAPVVLKEAHALLKVLLTVQTVADELYLLEGDLADDEGICVAGKAEAQ